jgi:hypothetical protein
MRSGTGQRLPLQKKYNSSESISANLHLVIIARVIHLMILRFLSYCVANAESNANLFYFPVRDRKFMKPDKIMSEKPKDNHSLLDKDPAIDFILYEEMVKDEQQRRGKKPGVACRSFC